MDDSSNIRFWEDTWVGSISCSEAVPCLYWLSTVLNSPIQNFVSILNSYRSWSFHFFRNLNDRENRELCSFGTFSGKSYFQFLSHSPARERFVLHKKIWTSKAPSKDESFVWSALLKRINTNKMLEVQWPLIAISPDICVICRSDSVNLLHLFLHCSAVSYLWNSSFFFGGSNHFRNAKRLDSSTSPISSLFRNFYMLMGIESLLVLFGLLEDLFSSNFV